MRRVMSRVLGEPGEPLHPQGRWEERGAHDVLGLGPDQKAVLMGYSPDALLERMWERRHADKLLDRIAQMGFDLVTSPDFSVYGDQPRFEHLFNMRRAMVFTQELVDRGVNAIPSVYWFRLEDLDRWLQWVEETEPSAICLPRHTSRHQGEWDLLAAPGLEYLGRQLDQLSANTKVLVTGVVNRDRVTQLGNWFGTRLIIASQQPVHLAAQGRRVTDEGREVYQAHRADLFSYNVQFYNRRVQQATSPTKA